MSRTTELPCDALEDAYAFFNFPRAPASRATVGSHIHKKINVNHARARR